jgi:hypothetical protein
MSILDFRPSQIQELRCHATLPLDSQNPKTQNPPFKEINGFELSLDPIVCAISHTGSSICQSSNFVQFWLFGFCEFGSGDVVQLYSSIREIPKPEISKWYFTLLFHKLDRSILSFHVSPPPCFRFSPLLCPDLLPM